MQCNWLSESGSRQATHGTSPLSILFDQDQQVASGIDQDVPIIEQNDQRHSWSPFLADIPAD